MIKSDPAHPMHSPPEMEGVGVGRAMLASYQNNRIQMNNIIFSH